MRWIADNDKQSIEAARNIMGEIGTLDALEAMAHLNSVLSNMRHLETEQSPQRPRTVPLTPKQRRAIYPERYR